VIALPTLREALPFLVFLASGYPFDSSLVSFNPKESVIATLSLLMVPLGTTR
jgi:hypothetical protein